MGTGKGSIRGRIDALERERTPPAPTQCSQCGAPRPGQNMLVCVKKDGTPRWGACDECGLALHADGRPISAIPVLKGKVIGPVDVYEPDRWWMFDCV